MKNTLSIKHTFAWTLFGALLCLGAIASAQENLVALGTVSSTGAVVRQANTVGGNVSASKPGTGYYTVQVSAAGAFAGATTNDFSVDVGIFSASLTDWVAVAAVTGRTDDTLTVTVRTSDVEDDINPNNPAARNAQFHFLIRRSDGSADASAGTRYLHAAGQASSAGNLVAAFGLGGAQVTTSQSGINGDYDITVALPGAYTNDADNDYIVFATAQGITTQDHVFGSNANTTSDDEVVISIRTADAQKAVNGDNPSASGSDFYFSIYRISDQGVSGSPQSALLLGSSLVKGNDGEVMNIANSLPGGSVTGVRLEEGLYRIRVLSPGAFAGRSANEFGIQLSISNSGNDDKVVRGNVQIQSDDELRIGVSTNDVEEDGQDFGVRTNSSFFYTLYDLVPSYQPDLRIGTKRRLTSQKGDDRINLRGAGQSVTVKVKGRAKKKFYTTAQNDGNNLDDVRLSQRGVKRAVKLRHYRLTGGRSNVTGAVKRGLIAAADLRPGDLVQFESQVRYSKLTKTPRLKILLKGTSDNDADAADAVRAKVVPVKK